MTAEHTGNSFPLTRRGYDRRQVDERLGQLVTELGAAVEGRDAAVGEVRALTKQLDDARRETTTARAACSEARSELDTLSAQVAEMSTVPTTVGGMSERLAVMVRSAQDEVNDMRARATRSSADVLLLAQAEADELRASSAKERRVAEAERVAAQNALRAQLKESQARLDRLRKDAGGQRAKLDAELAERRTQADRELAAEMDELRSEMLNELATHETRCRDEATRVVSAATAEAQRVRAEVLTDAGAARHDLEELRELQHQVTEQLTSVRMLLDWTLPKIAGKGRPGSGSVAVMPNEASPDDGVSTIAEPTDSTTDPAAGSDGGPPPAVPAEVPEPVEGTARNATASRAPEQDSEPMASPALAAVSGSAPGSGPTPASR